MIDYTFLLPGKNDFQYHPARLIRAQRKVLAFLKRSGVQRSVKIGELFPGKTVRGQGLNLFPCKQKKIPRRVLILKLTFISKASVEIHFRSKDNMI
jgi:hypothetical protein